MQTLFELDFNDFAQTNLEELVDKNVAEFAPGLDDPAFAQVLVEGVAKQREKIDEIITKAAPDWPLGQIANVDRNILRLGLYELLFGKREEVPARVAINEAIELAKTFGGEKSGKFINGVLGAVYKEMGEPGKDDQPLKKKRPVEVPFEQMPIEKLGGAVIYHQDEKGVHLALEHDIFGYWTLPKGHVAEGEDVAVGTVREVMDEMSLAVDIEQEIGFNEYVASHPEKGKLRKQVTYFLARSSELTPPKLGADKGGLDDAKWFPMTEVANLRMYDDVVPILMKALNIITGRQ
jgi:N utilization substance protein B